MHPDTGCSDPLSEQEKQKDEICKRISDLEARLEDKNRLIIRLKELLGNCYETAFAPKAESPSR